MIWCFVKGFFEVFGIIAVFGLFLWLNNKLCWLIKKRWNIYFIGDVMVGVTYFWAAIVLWIAVSLYLCGVIR